MRYREVVEMYGPNRKFEDIMEKYGTLTSAIDGAFGEEDALLDCKWKYRKRFWNGSIEIEGCSPVEIVIGRDFNAGFLSENDNVKMKYRNNVHRKDLGVVRRVLCASGLRRIVGKRG